MKSITRYFFAKGKVQNVMFRQTLIRAAQSRNLEAGATNLWEDRNQVSFTLCGESAEKMEEIVQFMRAGKQLNSWGAQVHSLEERETGTEVDKHEVHTGNVDSFQWSAGVEMYL